MHYWLSWTKKNGHFRNCFVSNGRERWVFHIYAWNDGRDPNGGVLIITMEWNPLDWGAALKPHGSISSSLHLFFNVHQPQYKKKRREEEKEGDVHVIQQPLCSPLLTNMQNHHSYCLFWHSVILLFLLIMFRSYIPSSFFLNFFKLIFLLKLT